jgi:serine/threonine protein kinase
VSLQQGTRVGPYEITGTLGAGGMGEVYRARDARLGRDVALKILPDIFATDPERLARFQREAQVLASLHHPNIAVIYGLEEPRALVLELVEGDTLADRIARVPKPLFDSGYIALNSHGGQPHHAYAVSADGQHFLIPSAATSRASDSSPPIAVVLNWAQGVQH